MMPLIQQRYETEAQSGIQAKLKESMRQILGVEIVPNPAVAVPVEATQQCAQCLHDLYGIGYWTSKKALNRKISERCFSCKHDKNL